LLTVPAPHGKLTPELVQGRIERIGDEHAVQPRVVSISQCTELGTVYSRPEVAALSSQSGSLPGTTKYPQETLFLWSR